MSDVSEMDANEAGGLADDLDQVPGAAAGGAAEPKPKKKARKAK